MDEFLIVAKVGNVERTWTRSSFESSKKVADQAFNKLAYPLVEVFNVFGGHKSDSLYTLPMKEKTK